MSGHRYAESIDSIDASPTTPFFPGSRDSSSQHPKGPLWRRYRQSLLLLAVFSLLSLTSFVLYTLPDAQLQVPGRTSFGSTFNDPRSPRLRALVGPPTVRFRDNLRNDTKYITSWISAGWTNDVMTYANLIYLGLITGRTAILHTFLPSHVGPGAPQIPFSDVFDIEYLSEKIGMPVLEFSDVKNMSTASEEIEEIGCWSVWEAVELREGRPRPVYTEWEQGLSISWTTAPPWVKKIPDYEHDRFARFWDLAVLTYPKGRQENLGTPQPSRTGATVHPDEHLVCFDYLYYACASTSDEFIREHSPAWRDVLRYFRWAPRMQEIADGYLRRMFGVAETDPIPPYITIHARRGDFGAYCGFANLTLGDCFPTMEDYARGIVGIRKELEQRLGISPKHIVMVSDEKDSIWWEVVRIMGWYTPDHEAEQTVERYGAWRVSVRMYPVFIDAVIQSSGVGLLGSPGSTMSIIAGRRVIDWHGGAYHNVPWKVCSFSCWKNLS
ncbi:hypothetical protein K488DRAFT_52104 [Vararia minispora EC-137]|uniref:Uncharacterized protein n=1 Tax=Vararia minispora EC-137 TaxID=1314806 RepID=A0ACB8QI39_9AGAM|nr:hypothetical protein K488DRAFT_52104 [Vararia minispora EC-137]